jgi:outer membrane protein assembly factor BamB
MRLGILILSLVLARQGGQPGEPKSLDWHQWRGPQRDGLSPDRGLLKQWPGGGPPLAWKATGMGRGYSSVSVLGDRLFTMGEAGGKSNLLALNPADGKVLWKVEIGAPGGNRGEGPRGTPATDGTLVFALGQCGELVCAEAATGKIRWQKSLESDFGGRRPNWFWSESPLLDGDRVLCTPGGNGGAVVCLNKETGATVWRSPALRGDAHYSSLVPVEIGGVRQYIVLTQKTVAGIAAADGKVLWRGDHRGTTAVCATPVYRDGIVMVTSAYGVGCDAYRITAAGGQFKAEQVYTGMQMENHHGGVIVVGDYAYGLSGHRRATLKCLELKTGKTVWESDSVGKGSVAYADGHLVVRSENGPIALVEATPTGYKERGRFSQPDRSREPSWPHPVIFGGKLYVRDQDVLLCYDVKAK